MRVAAGTSGTVRRSVIAGTWYPGDPQRLRAMIDGFLARVPSQHLEGDLVGLVVPHAGYMYSGQVAAYAYAQLSTGTYSRVIIVSPVHRVYSGRFAVTEKAYYETPLGLVPVDEELVQALEQHVTLTRIPQDSEHSLEIQLPFLQQVLGNFQLVPIMMGDQDYQSASELGQALAQALDQTSALLVASTDLSHFHNYDTAVSLDQLVLDRITAFDPAGLSQTLAMHKAEACGGGPVAAVMVAAERQGADRAVLLKYMNSGDVTGDRASVVGYAAAALLRS